MSSHRQNGEIHIFIHSVEIYLFKLAHHVLVTSTVSVQSLNIS